MNRIINTYGAPNMSNPAGEAVQRLDEELAYALRTILVNHNLSPEEIIATNHRISGAVDVVCSEQILRQAIALRKAEREKAMTVDVAAAKVVEFANQELKTKKVSAKRDVRTPAQWCEFFGVEVIDPDGWNRYDPNCMSYPISQSMFIECYQKSTCRIVDSDKFRKYQHLFC